MQLDPGILQSFAVAKTVTENTARVNSLAFHRTEPRLVTAGEDLTYINTLSGEALKVVQSRKYGAAHVVFTHAPDCVVHASTKGADHAVRYLSLHDGSYIRYFRGHEHRVTCLAMSPVGDAFLSASKDRTVRLWDLRKDGTAGLMPTPEPATAAFDEQGLVFAVAAGFGCVRLFDIRNYATGPFATFTVGSETQSSASFTWVRFSQDGEMLAAALDGRITLLDAFKGRMLHQWSTGVPPGSSVPEFTFTPDSQFLLSGCQDLAIRAWSTQTGTEVAALRGCTAMPRSLKWAPSKALLASADDASAVLWLPDLGRLRELGVIQ